MRRRAWLVALLVLGLGLTAPAARASSWVQRALALQYSLGGDVALRNAPWLSTHNSFNSPAEMGPTLSDQDPNQKIPLTAQLDAGMRGLELDLHRFPSVTGGGFAPVVCHALGNHAGCSIEKPLAPVLREIAGWLRGHRDQVLLLYLEDHSTPPRPTSARHRSSVPSSAR